MRAKDKLKPPPAAKVTRTKVGVYVGRRTTTDGKLAYFWQMDGEDKPGGWLKQVVPAQIGESFRFSYDGNSVYTSGEHRPAKLEACTDFDKVAEWIVLDEAAYQRDLERKAVRMMKSRESEFELAMQPLRRILSRVSSHADRSALAARIATELMRKSRD